MNNLIWLFLIALVAGACSAGEEETDSTYLRDEAKIIKIDVEKARTVKMSEVFSGIRYLPLEIRKDHLIGRIQKILFEDGKIFLLSGSSVFIYTESGTFIRQIEIQEGKGPGELIAVFDFVVHPDLDQISVLGFTGINRYSYSGSIVKEYKLNIGPKRIGLLANGNYALYMDYSLYKNETIESLGYNLLYMKPDNGEIYNKMLSIAREQINMGTQEANNFPTYAGKQLFYASPDYHVYELTKGEIRARYYLDFGAHKLPGTFYENRENFNTGVYFIQKAEKEGYVLIYTGFMETDQAIHFSFSRELLKPGVRLFYSKETGKTLVADSIVNDIDYGPAPYFWAYRGNELVMFVQPSDLIEKAKEIKQTLSREELEQYMQREPNLIDLTRDMSPSDNPVLMFCEVKSF